MLHHDQNGRPIEWTATEQLRRQRKALRDGILALILILLGWVILLTLVAPRLKAQELTLGGLGGAETRLSPAEPLPSMPTAKIEPTPVAITNRPTLGRFWDRPNKISAIAMLSLASADMAQTCRNLARGGHEDWLTQSCGKDVAITAAFEAGALAGAWALHRRGHHRLERMPMLFMAAQSARGLQYSQAHGAW